MENSQCNWARRCGRVWGCSRGYWHSRARSETSPFLSAAKCYSGHWYSTQAAEFLKNNSQVSFNGKRDCVFPRMFTPDGKWQRRFHDLQRSCSCKSKIVLHVLAWKFIGLEECKWGRSIFFRNTDCDWSLMPHSYWAAGWQYFWVMAWC